jgi:tetratricopeptide (TPR) repeat protein
MARSSAFALRGRDIKTVGSELNVGSVVEGSVRRSGDELRITAQLIRVADGSHLWSGRYDRALADVFAIQAEIAREMAEALRAELGVDDPWSWVKEMRYRPRDVRAYELVLAGERIMWRSADDATFEGFYTAEGIRKAIDYYERALEIDPNYAYAHSQLGWAYIQRWVWQRTNDQDLLRARSEAERALTLDETNGSAQNLLASILMGEWDWEGARRILERGLDLNPRHGPLRASYGFLLLPCSGSFCATWAGST